MIDKIKELLGEELAQQVTEKLDGIELAVANDGTYVPAEKHDGMKKELKEYKTKLEEANNLVKELNDKAGLADEWKTKATELQDKYESFEKETEQRLESYKKRSMVKDLISESFPKSAVDLILDKYDLDTVEIKDDKLRDADELLTKLKTEYSDLAITKSADSTIKDEQHEKTTDNVDHLREYMGLPPIITKG